MRQMHAVSGTILAHRAGAALGHAAAVDPKKITHLLTGQTADQQVDDPPFQLRQRIRIVSVEIIRSGILLCHDRAPEEVGNLGVPEGREKIAWECSRGPNYNMADSGQAENREQSQ